MNAAVFSIVLSLEWVSDTEVENKVFPFEPFDNPTLSVGHPGGIEYGYAHIYTEQEEFKIIAQADSCAEGEFFVETVELEFSVGIGIVGTAQPDVAGIGEYRTAQPAYDGKPLLKIEHKADVPKSFKVAPTFG